MDKYIIRKKTNLKSSEVRNSRSRSPNKIESEVTNFSEDDEENGEKLFNLNNEKEQENVESNNNTTNQKNKNLPKVAQLKNSKGMLILNRL